MKLKIKLDMKTKYKTSGIFFTKLGTFVIRYGLACILIWIGVLKFSEYEANGIFPLAENSPLFNWIFNFMSPQGFSNFLGTVEILTGMLLAVHFIWPKLSVIGSAIAIITFLVTLSFIVSTPGVIQSGYLFPFISASPGQFLIKDLVLLGASFYTAGESLKVISES